MTSVDGPLQFADVGGDGADTNVEDVPAQLPGTQTRNQMPLESIDLDGSITLVLGWMSSGKIKLAQVAISQSVEDRFRAIIHDCVEELLTREAERWSPEAVVSPETYLATTTAMLGEQPVLARDIASHRAFPRALREATSLPVLHANKLPAAAMSMYAFVVGDDLQNRAVLVRRANPRRSLRRGGVIAAMGDALTRIAEPLFAFDEAIDLVIVGDEIGVLSQTAFAAFFRSNEALTALIPKWVDAIEVTIPFTADGRALLLSKAGRDSRIRRRVESIVARGHLAGVTTDVLREVITDAGMDPDLFVSAGDELIVTDENVFNLLHILNEDLYEGPLSSARFRVDRKHVR